MNLAIGLSHMSPRAGISQEAQLKLVIIWLHLAVA
jgi:hypothetical protein